MNCDRCNSTNIQWNDAGYLLCFNCGKVHIEPTNVSPIIKGIMEYGLQVKERLWKLRSEEKQDASAVP